MPELYDDEMSDERWWENSVLAALDEELEPVPSQWELELEDSWWQGWENLASGGPEVLALDRTCEHYWKGLVRRREAQMERLLGLGAPQVILRNQMQLVAKARAGYYWQWAKRLGELNDEPR